MFKSLLKTLGYTVSAIALLPLQAQSYNDCNANLSYCDPCAESENCFWIDADYLYWQVEDSPEVIPLVIEQPTVEGPSTVVLGGKKIKNDWHSGGRFSMGCWLDECESFGSEINYFFLGKKTHHTTVASDANGSPRLRVPYFNVTTGLPDSSALATPGVYRGEASLTVFNKMQGVEWNVLEELCPNFKVLAGFRYWSFEDNLTFYANSPLVVEPTIYNYQDKFQTRNNFYGGQIGVSFKQGFSCLSFDVKGTIAFGAMCQKLSIKGRFQTGEFTGSVETISGGFFALPSNIGTYKKTKFSAIPEITANLAYHFTDDLSINLGYSLIYATEVLRASKQVSNNLNPTQSANIEFVPAPLLVGDASPKAKLKSTNLWVQGINAGLGFTF